jgi:hypothetical protein
MTNDLLTRIHERTLDRIADQLADLQDQTLMAWCGFEAGTAPRILKPWFDYIATIVAHRLQWYHIAIGAAIRAGRCQVIPTRRGDGLYLLRCWLSTPRAAGAGDHVSDGCRYESGNATLLHFFAAGDDDGALHDHPWAFTTEILAGGYAEHLPGIVPCEGLGPDLGELVLHRGAGDRIPHQATDLHCVTDTQPGTITLVTTGPRTRSWGFHPPGRPWIGYQAYFAQRQAAAGATP